MHPVKRITPKTHGRTLVMENSSISFSHPTLSRSFVFYHSSTIVEEPYLSNLKPAGLHPANTDAEPRRLSESKMILVRLLSPPPPGGGGGLLP